MKFVKQFTNRKDRMNTKTAIGKGDYSKIPPNSRTKVEDVWAWD